MLAEIFADFPLRGRKRLEAEIWDRAVRVLAHDRYAAHPRIWRELAELAPQTRRVRRYREPSGAAAENCADRSFVDYFGGFFSGDGWLLLPKTGDRHLSSPAGGRLARFGASAGAQARAVHRLAGSGRSRS